MSITFPRFSTPSRRNQSKNRNQGWRDKVVTRNCVLFRVDATKQTGKEGLMRCLTFAAALQRRRRPCHFLSRLEPNAMASLIQRGDTQWLPADAPIGSSDDLEEITREIRRLRPSAVVIDSSDCGPEYLSELVSLGSNIFVIDNGASYRFPSQLLIHPLLNKSHEDYHVSPGTQVLCGSRYALVRPGIRRIRSIRGQEPPEPFRCVISLGDDPANWTMKLTKSLMNYSKLSKIDILARTGHAKLPEWQKFAEEHKGHVSVSLEVLDQSRKVSRCHVAITEADTGALELACIGVPMICLTQNDMYVSTAQKLEEEGAAVYLGDIIKESQVRSTIDSILNDPAERRQMARAGRALIDGRGPDRLVNALEITLHPARQFGISEAA